MNSLNVSASKNAFPPADPTQKHLARPSPIGRVRKETKMMAKTPNETELWPSSWPDETMPSRRSDTSVAHPARVYAYWLGGCFL
jgi:hypothetical protein